MGADPPRPIFLSTPVRCKKGGSGLNAAVQSLPPEQFAISSAKSVLTLVDMWMGAAVARYGQGNFRWVAMVGDLSVMYDEIDPALACEMAQEAIGNLPSQFPPPPYTPYPIP